MDYNTIPNIDESDVSRDISCKLGDSSYRSGSGSSSQEILPWDVVGGNNTTSHNTNINTNNNTMQQCHEEKIMEEDDERSSSNSSGEKKDKVADELPNVIATPSASQGDISTRMAKGLTLPPLPMGVGSNYANHVSPATPMPPKVAVGPTAAHSAKESEGIETVRQQETVVGGSVVPEGVMLSPPTPSPDKRAALAALYQSSRRSRTNTPQSTSSKHATSVPQGASFPPPPPLFAPPSSPDEDNAGGEVPQGIIDGGLARRSHNQTTSQEQQQQETSNTTNVPHVSLQSSTNTSSFIGHESWNTSMSSLMNSSSFLNASLSMNNSSRDLSRSAMMPSRPNPTTTTTGEKKRMFQLSNFMDYKIEDNRSRRSSTESSNNRRSSVESDRSSSGHRPTPLARVHERPNLMNYKMEDDSGEEEQEKSSSSPESGSMIPTVPNLSGDSSEGYQGEGDAAAQTAPPSPAIGKMEQLSLSSLQVRSRDQYELNQTRPVHLLRQESFLCEKFAMKDVEEEEEEGQGENEQKLNIKNVLKGYADGVLSTGQDQDRREGEEEEDNGSIYKDEPPKKKNKMRSRRSTIDSQEQYYPQTPSTHKSVHSSASFDIIALEPSSRVSSIYDPEDDVSPLSDVDMNDLLRSDADVINETFAEVNVEHEHEMGMMSLRKQMQQEGGQGDDVGQGVDDSKISSEALGQDQQDAHAYQHGQEVSPRHHDRSREETSSEKEQRILRRKIQRLLLIRHCTTCTFPQGQIPPLPLSSTTVDPPGHDATSTRVDGEIQQQQGGVPLSHLTSMICPVTSHCAEGKALCAHIKSCRLTDCTYKKCLTTRDILFHYKNCRDLKCEVCVPVRSLDRSQSKPSYVESRRKSDSSIETIDDEAWLNIEKATLFR